LEEGGREKGDLSNTPGQNNVIYANNRQSLFFKVPAYMPIKQKALTWRRRGGREKGDLSSTPGQI